MIIIKNGFSLIEFIFVIIILGILAAVSLPKFIDAGNEAHIFNLKLFQSSLNRTVNGEIWNKVSHSGDVNNLKGNDQLLSNYIEIPQIFKIYNIDANLSNTNKIVNDKKDILNQTIKCNHTLFRLQNLNNSDFYTTINNKNYYIDVCNGNNIDPIKFYIIGK